MDLPPTSASFAATYEAGRPQVVWTSLVADLETPVSALLKLADGRPYSFLLESVEGGAIRGRYSIIGLKPDLIWRCRGDTGRDQPHAPHRPPTPSRLEAKPPLDSPARPARAERRMEIPAALPPMASGLFGYLGYDMVRLMERLPEPNADPLGLPDAVFVRPTVVAIFDSVRGRRHARRRRSGPPAASPPAPPTTTPASACPTRPSPTSQRHRRTQALATPLDLGRPGPEHDARGLSATWSTARRTTSLPATSSRWCPASASAAVQAAAVRALPHAAPPEPLALPLLPELRRLRGRRLQPGNPRPPARRQGHHPPDRRHRPPRHDAGRGRGTREPSCSPTRRSAPST